MLRHADSLVGEIAVVAPSTRVHVDRLRTMPECHALLDSWNALAMDLPFRRWEWLGSWWKHYGAQKELFVLTIRADHGELLGIAPWYLDQDRTIRFLGDGKACSDYLSLLTGPQHRDIVVRAVSDWLLAVDHQDDPDHWDAIEWEAIPCDDPAIGPLTSMLQQSRCAVLQRPAACCYRAELPGTVAEYIQSRAKTNRLTMRRIQRKLATKSQSYRHICSAEQLNDELWDLFVDLHQMRRATMNEQGCFSFPPFGEFLREATTALMAQGMSSLLFVYDEQTPMAVLHLLHNRDTTFVYQSGMDHGVKEKRPGYVANSIGIWWTIERGAARYDLLRGDEAYKQRWRGEPAATHDIRISSRRTAARWRHQWLAAGFTMKDWVKAGLAATGLR